MSGQEKNQFTFCERDFVGPFTVCWIHLLGNTKGDTGGVGFTAQSTIPDCPFLNKIVKTEFLSDLRKGDDRGVRPPPLKVMEEIRSHGRNVKL